MPAGSAALGVAILTLAAGFALGTTPVSAQRVDVELGAGAAVGNYTDTGAGLDVLPRPSFGIRVDVWPTESLAAYIGFTRSSFGCEEGFCADRETSFTSQGLVLGGQWSPGLPWLRAGLAMQGLDIDATGGAGEGVEPGPGVELAAGLNVRLGDRVRVRPGVRYLRHETSTELGDGHVALLAFEIGVAASVVSF